LPTRRRPARHDAVNGGAPSPASPHPTPPDPQADEETPPPLPYTYAGPRETGATITISVEVCATPPRPRFCSAALAAWRTGGVRAGEDRCGARPRCAGPRKLESLDGGALQRAEERCALCFWPGGWRGGWRGGQGDQDQGGVSAGQPVYSRLGCAMIPV